MKSKLRYSQQSLTDIRQDADVRYSGQVYLQQASSTTSGSKCCRHHDGAIVHTHASAIADLPAALVRDVLPKVQREYSQHASKRLFTNLLARATPHASASTCAPTRALQLQCGCLRRHAATASWQAALLRRPRAAAYTSRACPRNRPRWSAPAASHSTCATTSMSTSAPRFRPLRSRVTTSRSGCGGTRSSRQACPRPQSWRWPRCIVAPVREGAAPAWLPSPVALRARRAVRAAPACECRGQHPVRHDRELCTADVLYIHHNWTLRARAGASAGAAAALRDRENPAHRQRWIHIFAHFC